MIKNYIENANFEDTSFAYTLSLISGKQTEKFSTIFCQSNSGSTAEKNGDTSLFFRFFDGVGQTWL